MLGLCIRRDIDTRFADVYRLDVHPLCGYPQSGCRCPGGCPLFPVCLHKVLCFARTFIRKAGIRKAGIRKAGIRKAGIRKAGVDVLAVGMGANDIDFDPHRLDKVVCICWDVHLFLSKKDGHPLFGRSHLNPPGLCPGGRRCKRHLRFCTRTAPLRHSRVWTT